MAHVRLRRCDQVIAIPLLLLALIVVVVVIARRGTAGSRSVTRGQSVRRFFQYALMLGMLIVLASGLIGLLTRLFGVEVLFSSEEELARSLAFVVVGGPAFVFLAMWARRQLMQDPQERTSAGWAFYVSAAALISLISSLGPLRELLGWALGTRSWDGGQLASVLVWLSAWVVHFTIARATLPAKRSLPHYLIGSLIGLVLSGIGLANTLGASFNALVDFGDPFIGSSTDSILRSITWVLIGVPVWYIYWIRTAERLQRDQLWFIYVFLAGVAGGLITAISAGSVVIYDTLVWFVGEPRVSDAAGHFDALGISLGTALIGLLIWWYHRTLIENSSQRNEQRRVYEYVMSAGGLGALSTGVAVLLVAFIESVSRTSVIAGGSAVNSLLLAVTLLMVGLPVWLMYWRTIQRADSAQEHTSPTRRFYLFVLFGVGAIAAVVSLLTTVYLLFTDLLEGAAGGSTLREMRFSLAIVMTAGAISGYHWSVYRKERHVTVREARLRSILVIGASAPEQVRLLADATDARVRIMEPLSGASLWTADQVIQALPETLVRDLVVIADGSQLRVIPVEQVHD